MGYFDDEVSLYYQNLEINTINDTFDTLFNTISFANINLCMFTAFL